MRNTAPTSVRVLVVLFRTAPAVVSRLQAALGAAARHAREAGLARRVVLALGDCSPTPALEPEQVEALVAGAAAAGLDEVEYRFFDANLGSAGGNARLGLEAPEDFLFVLNPDTYPAPTVLAELLRAAADPSVGIAEARQLPLEHPKAFDLARGDTSWASGACSLVRREAYARVGGHDTEHFFLYCDDVDLSWRVRHAGFRVVHVPRALVFHDKRLDGGAHVVPTETEQYFGLLGRLMLLRRFGEPRLLAETVAYVEHHGTPEQRRALAEYRAREAAGRLPARLPGADRVAQFIRGEYADHRF